MPERIIDGEVRGLKETQKEMERIVRELSGPPMVQAFRDSALMVTRDSKKNAPVDSGRGRASITPEVRVEGREVMGVVGSNVEYMAYQELGTRPHWPPVSALETWARRHGTEAFLVARAISRRGTKAVKFLQRAFESNRTRIIKRIERAVGNIVK